MANVKFKILCKKCKKYYLPDGTKASRFGYCEKCRIFPGKCKELNESGYQCQEEVEFFGYCKEHFLTVPVSKLKDEARKLKEKMMSED